MIYLHVPFCHSFCVYCDFYSELLCKGTDDAVIQTYTSNLCREIDARRQEILKTRSLDTLYIGGGTPSVLPLNCLEKVLSCLRARPYKEFTFELNPEDVLNRGEQYLRALKNLGVNRVSLGVQSLDDAILRWMNRRHSASGARDAFNMLRAAGFENISVDIIFGISHLELKTLMATLSELIQMRPEHISAYSLSIEEGSALAKMIKEGCYTEAEDEYCRAQYDLICAQLSAAGYHHYEVSNWARPGYEAVHNSAYWTRHPYVGLGPGAHSLSIEGQRQVRSWNSENISAWTSESEVLSAEDIKTEEIMLSLRTDTGYKGKVVPESSWFVIDDIISDLI